MIILEAVRCDYPWASDRLHQFILEGMAENAADALRSRARYYPYVEPSRRHGRGLLRALSSTACAVVTDWYPTFFLPAMLTAAATQVGVSLEAVDSNGLIPLRAAGKYHSGARFYRAFMQRALRDHLRNFPAERPLALLRGPRLKSSPPASPRAGRRQRRDCCEADRPRSRRCPSITRSHLSTSAVGSGRRRRNCTVSDRGLARYADDHNHPDLTARAACRHTSISATLRARGLRDADGP